MPAGYGKEFLNFCIVKNFSYLAYMDYFTKSHFDVLCKGISANVFAKVKNVFTIR